LDAFSDAGDDAELVALHSLTDAHRYLDAEVAQYSKRPMYGISGQNRLFHSWCVDSSFQFT
jgi:hypothetical protein